MREHCVRRSGKNKMCNFDGIVQLGGKESDPKDKVVLGDNAELRRTSRKVMILAGFYRLSANILTDYEQTYYG